MNLELLQTFGLSFLLSVLSMIVYRFGMLKGGLSLRTWIMTDSKDCNAKIVTGAGILLLGVTSCWTSDDPCVSVVIGCIITLGFIDDGFKLSAKFRLVAYGIGAMVILYFFVDTLNIDWLLVLVVFVGFVGFVNAVNFMDGINGMVALQCVVILTGMLCSGDWKENELFIELLLGWAFAFSIFNIRNIPKLFLGDAGSIGLGFSLFTLMIPKLLEGNSWGYLIYFAVIAVDVLSVIVARLFRGENIFERHLLHVYQRLVIQKKFSEPTVSMGFALIQTIVTQKLLLAGGFVAFTQRNAIAASYDLS